MRLPDRIIGLLAAAFGVGVAITASRFPPAPGQNLGPGLFPMLIGSGIALGGIVLAMGARRPAERRGGGPPPVEAPARGGVWRAALVVGALLFYAAVVEIVGFFLTAFALLVALFLAFGVQRRWVVPLAAAVTLALHGAFYTLLRVPLPWGWLESIAW